MEQKIAADIKKLLVKAHARHLMAEVEEEAGERKKAIEERE